MSAFSQRSFSGGEIAPSLRVRVDLQKYASSLSTMRNFYTLKHGGAQSRPGTKYIGQTKTSSDPVRIVPFIFNESNSYVIEFGNQYMRFIKKGAYLTVNTVPGGGATVWSSSFPYVTGAIVFKSPKFYYAKADSTNKDPSNLANASYWYELTGNILEIPTPYLVSDDLMEMQYTQSADVMTFVHKLYPPMELKRLGSDVYWKFSQIAFTPKIGQLDGSHFFIGAGPSGSEAYTYTCTCVDKTNYEEGLAGAVISGTGLPTASVSTPVTLKIYSNFVSNVAEFNIYKQRGSSFGYIGTVQADPNTSPLTVIDFKDIGITPNTTQGPPIKKDVFSVAGEYPGVVGYMQQRLAFANTTNNREKIYVSRTGRFYNFTVSSPTQADDSITFNLAGRTVNEVRHILELAQVVILTSAGEWVIKGDNGIIKPGEINPEQHSYNGASRLMPIVANGNALYVQARNSIVRDLAYDFASDGYKGNDLTIFSSHLFDGYTIKDWAYQATPHSLVWAVRDDGTVLGLTYNREHEMFAWHRHDFDSGVVENVAVVPEGNEDAVYFVVKRTINGVEKRYVERMYNRLIGDQIDAVFMDCAKTIDGRGGLAQMKLTGTGWAPSDSLTLVSNAADAGYPSLFSASDVGNKIRLTSGTDVVVCTITGFTDGDHVVVHPDITVPVSMRNVFVNQWDKAVRVVTGLSHLEGKDVSVVADGYVLGSPYNSSYEKIKVTGGQITLDSTHYVIHVGLPITADLETLDVDSAQSEPMVNKKKNVGQVTLHMEKSRGAWVGASEPTGTNPLEGLTEIKPVGDLGEVPELVTGSEKQLIRREWNSNGRIFVRQVDPLPLTILAITPEGMLPGGGG